MKTIVCFGDSNTYGESPEGFGRYERHERWTGILSERLGSEYYVVEEGLGGRTATNDDPVEGDKNGFRHLHPIVESHVPMDLLIIMLGTNDFKHRFSNTPSDIAWGMERLIREAQKIPNGRRETPFQILLLCPPVLCHEILFGEIFGDRAEDSARLSALYQKVAENTGVHYMNLGEYVETSKIDGLHLDREAHKKAAAAIEKKIREIFQ